METGQKNNQISVPSPQTPASTSQTPLPETPVVNKKSRKTLIFLSLAVFILALLAGGLLFYQNYQQQQALKIKADDVKAEQNKALSVLPADFSKEYLPQNFSKVLETYGFPPKEDQPYSIKFSYDKPVAEVYSEAKAYFQGKGLEVAETIDRETKKPAYIFYVKDGEKNINFMFKQAEQGTEVALTVIAKKSQPK